MATKIVDADGNDAGLANAIKDTEREIFGEGSGSEPLELDGDRSLEEMGSDLEGRTNDADDDGEVQDDSEQTDGDEAQGDEPGGGEAEAKDDTQEAGEQVRDDSGKFTGERVPSGRLREETEKRRAAETEAQALRREIAELKGRVDGMNSRPAPAKEAETKSEVPDMFSDPEGYTAYVMQHAENRAIKRVVDASLDDARATHGKEFDAAYTELTRLGAVETRENGRSSTVAKIVSAPNPGRALMTWHKEQTALREIGGDLSGYEKKIQDKLLENPEFVAKVIERANSQARGGQGGLRKLPSLNGASGGGRHMEADLADTDGSEKGVFRFAFQ